MAAVRRRIVRGKFLGKLLLVLLVLENAPNRVAERMSGQVFDAFEPAGENRTVILAFPPFFATGKLGTTLLR